MTTPLYPTFQKRISDSFEQLIRNQVTPWAFFNSGNPMKVKTYDQREISYKGIGFDGSPRHVFWSRYIEPFMEDISITEIDAAVKMAEERNVDATLLLSEVEGLLLVGVRKIFSEMAKTDQRLRGRGCPEKIPLRSIEKEFENMKSFIEVRVQSELKMWQPENTLTRQTGHTVYDLLIQIWKKYNLRVIVVCTLLFFGGWLFVHYLAEPGSQVSVWGLFAYTKKGDKPIALKPVHTTSAPSVAGCPPPISNKGQETSLQIYKAWANKHPDVLKIYGPPTICKFASIWGQFFEKGYIAYNVTHAWTVLFFSGEKEFRKLQNPGAHLTPGSGRQVDEVVFEEITRGMTGKKRSFYRSLIDNRVKSPDFKGTGIIGGIGTLYVREWLYPALKAPKENEYLTHGVLIASGSGYEVLVGLSHGLGGTSDTSPKSIYVLYDAGRYERHVEFPIDTPKGFQ